MFTGWFAVGPKEWRLFEITLWWSIKDQVQVQVDFWSNEKEQSDQLDAGWRFEASVSRFMYRVGQLLHLGCSPEWFVFQV